MRCNERETKCEKWASEWRKKEKLEQLFFKLNGVDAIRSRSTRTKEKEPKQTLTQSLGPLNVIFSFCEQAESNNTQ